MQLTTLTLVNSLIPEYFLHLGARKPDVGYIAIEFIVLNKHFSTITLLCDTFIGFG